MKRILAIAACAAIAASALCACDSRDGRISDSSRASVVSGTDTSERNGSMNASSRTERDTSGAHSRDGVLHETASMIGEVGEDIADGAENVGSSVVSDVKDVTDGRDDTDSDNM